MEAPGQIDSEAQTIGVIDVGSNSIRMAIAQLRPDGEIEVLERMQRAVRLGQDTFVQGRLGQRATSAAVGVLRDFRRVLDTYRVRQVRAVATSAVREASNSDPFLDRVLMATGLEVEVIEPSQESRLTMGAVRQAMGDCAELRRRHALIVDVGGGSALLTLLHGGEISASVSCRLGSIRLQEMLATSRERPERAADLLRHQIANTVQALKPSLPLKRVRSFIAVGGDARFAARQIGRPHAGGEDLHAIDAGAFDEFVDACAAHSADALARRYRLEFADAETLVPALLAYRCLLQETAARQMLVVEVSMRDGLLLDAAQALTGREDEALAAGILQSARSIAEKYGCDAAHADHVAELATVLFDALRSQHGLGPRPRLLLRLAAVLHECGGYVSSRAHHKHSLYLIANSEIFGLRREEQLVVAHVARYHRRGCPKPSHVEYMSLPRETRMVVSKLAALLRVADALDHGHAQQLRDIQVEKAGDELVIYVPHVADLALERRSLAAKADLFQEIYGARVRLEPAAAAPAPPRRPTPTG